MRAVAPGVAAAALILASLAGAPAAATTITAAFTDLDDTSGPGGDLWEAAYTVSGFSFQAGQGFSIEFGPTLYADLSDPEPGVHEPAWSVLVIQPSTTLPDAGLYDALAQVDDPADAGPFRVRFVWLGGAGTTPGAQAFTVNEFDADGALLARLDEGTTLVPEPAPALLAASAAAACVGLAVLLGPGARRR